MIQYFHPWVKGYFSIKYGNLCKYDISTRKICQALYGRNAFIYLIKHAENGIVPVPFSIDIAALDFYYLSVPFPSYSHISCSHRFLEASSVRSGNSRDRNTYLEHVDNVSVEGEERLLVETPSHRNRGEGAPTDILDRKSVV